MAASNFTEGTGRGAIAGLIAGVVFFLVVGLSQLRAGGFFFLAKASAIPFFGPSPGAGSILVGLLIFVALAVAWGIAFGWAAWSQPKGLTVMMGIAWGSLMWAVMTYGVARFVGAGDWVNMAPLGRYLVAHVIYGAVLGLAFAAMQRREERPGRILPELRAEARA